MKVPPFGSCFASMAEEKSADPVVVVNPLREQQGDEAAHDLPHEEERSSWYAGPALALLP